MSRRPMMYEFLYILSGSFTDAEVDGEMKAVEGLLTKHGGEFKSHKKLSRLALAYPIKKMKHGTYVLAYFTAEPEALKSINKEIELHDAVLRHLIIRATEADMNNAYEVTNYEYPLKEKGGSTRKVAKKLAPPAPAVAPKADMSVEEIDKKIDEIIDGESSETNKDA